MQGQSGIRKIAFIGNYLPRQCGIATFTTSLCEAMAGQFPEIQCFSVPVTDIEEGYDYPERVRFEIKEWDLSSYERAADFLNTNNVDVACLQHEFGIYGGSAGSYILILLRRLKMPVVTTLHTVLTEPNDQQLRVMNQILNLSDRIVAMTNKSLEILERVYQVDKQKVTLIPHGILDVPFVDPNFYKDLFGVEGKTVLLTFGLLSPDKGIEQVIQALPKIVEKYPNTVYIVLGATHPNLVRHEGETYRLQLQYMAEDLGVQKNVIFYNRFVTSEELKEFIGASDIYITPYLKEAQITSGTLAYSFGAGKAVISTPYWHAKELLTEGKGILVPFRDSSAIAKEVIYLIENETQRHAIRKNAYVVSREMIWSNVACLYRKAFEEARVLRLKYSQPTTTKRLLDSRIRELPKVKLDHLMTMTDSTGILHKAAYTVPDFKEGYRTDDNAKALILYVLLEELTSASVTRTHHLGSSYLAFLSMAINKETGWFKKELTFDRKWVDDNAGEECHGKALWALGMCIGRSRNEGFQNLASQLFEKTLPASFEFTSPRAWAYTLLGIHEYFRRFDGDRFANHGRELLSKRLYELFTKDGSPQNNWFSNNLAGNNATLPHALIMSGKWVDNKEMLNAGLESLQWLCKIQTSPKNCFRPARSGNSTDRVAEIGYDQLPSEAQATIAACLEAYRITEDRFWLTEARKAFEWFLGRNDVGVPLYDSKTGGCRDSLLIDRVNHNEGAEASISFYLSLVELQSIENTIASFRDPNTNLS